MTQRFMADKPRRSVYDALKDAGRRTSRATIEATKRFSNQVVLAADSEAQKFVECAVLTDINRVNLKCDDVKAFHSVMPQYLIGHHFADVPFRIENAENQTTLFMAHLTPEEFIIESLDGKPMFSVVFAEDQSSNVGAELQAIGKIKHPSYGIQLYRILQLFNKIGKHSCFVVRKMNEPCNEPFLRVTVKHPFFYKIAKWFGFVMDSRVFNCCAGEKFVAKIRPKVGWNAANLGYSIRYEDDYNNYTVKTVCLAFTLMMFLKYSPLDFESMLTSE